MVNPVEEGLLDLKRRFLSRMVEGDGFWEMVEPYIRLLMYGAAPEDRPAAVFYIYGPTGSGKSYSIKSLGEAVKEFYASADSPLVWYNCAEYQESHQIARMLGAPPGYIGHDSTKTLIDMAAAIPPSVRIKLLAFDEIDKAHQSLSDLVLGLIDTGGLRDGRGKYMVFAGWLVFFTSNLGASSAEFSTRLGFNPASTSQAYSKAFSALRPEFKSRITAWMTFERPDEEVALRVAEHEVGKVARRLRAATGLVVKPGAKILKALAEEASGPDGLRGMRGLLDRVASLALSKIGTAKEVDLDSLL